MRNNKHKLDFNLITHFFTRKLSKLCGYITCFLIIICFDSCNKLVKIPPPSTTITTNQVFADSSDASAAISGLYSRIEYGISGLAFCNGAQTIICGLSSDELIGFNSDNYLEFYSNSLEPTDGDLYTTFWQEPYNYIYQANACIEALQASSNLSQAVKNQFSGEAKFFRGLFYFYLVNLFGDVPYVTSTSWKQTDTIGRTNSFLVYEKIINDLQDAQNVLNDDYSISAGQRTRINKDAATALLARVYLFLKDWKNAELQASSIIGNSQFSLEPDLNNVFSVNSNESILQWQLNTSYVFYNCTMEGYNILPPDSTLPPNYYITDELYNSFDSGDNRKVFWLNHSTYNGITYNYPYKYKLGQQQISVNGSPNEYYTVLRLAEQYLIRAEARAHQGEIDEAISDLNMIRNRAGLPNTSATTQSDLLKAILHERQVELFAEWGHRWLDLKRTGLIDTTMSTATPLKNVNSIWNSYQQLYPIPSSQITINPFLSQNPGY